MMPRTSIFMYIPLSMLHDQFTSCSMSCAENNYNINITCSLHKDLLMVIDLLHYDLF